MRRLRETVASRPAPARLLVASAYVALTLVYAWPLLGRMSTVLPHDVGDPALNAWIIWWNAHAWPLTEAWWNAPIFHPATGAFALSETFLSVAPLTTPLQWLGLDAIVTYNVTFLVSFPLTALAAHALAHRLTGRHDAAFIAGLALGFCPWRTAQMPHLQMLLMWWMPLTLFFLHRYLHPAPEERDRGSQPEPRHASQPEPRDASQPDPSDRGSAWNLVGAGVCWLMNGLTSGYFLVYFGVLIGVWALWFVRTRRDWIAVAATLVLSSLPLVPLLLGYHRIQSGYGLARSPEEISAFSADLSAIWATSPDVWLPSHWTIPPRAEGELYPGAMIMLLSAIGAVSAWHAHSTRTWHRFRKWAAIVAGAFATVAIVSWMLGGWTVNVAGIDISLTRPAKALFVSVFVLAVAILWDRRLLDVWRRRSGFFFYAGGAGLMLLFALGPTARVFGHSFMYATPYSWLMELPGGGALRVPARFGVLFMLCLGQAAALAFARLRTSGVFSTRIREEKTPDVFSPVAVLIALVVFLEGWVPKLPVDPVPPHFDLLQMRPEMPLLELPILSGYTEVAAMLRATRHGHRLLNGTSGYSPPHYDRMVSGLQERDPTVLAALQAHGPFVVFVNSALDEGGRMRDLMDQYPGASLIGRSQNGTLYALPGQHSSAKPAEGSALRIASIAVSARPEDTAALTDHNVKTRWETIGAQTPGEQIVVTFDRPATITRLEMDLGEWSNDYPRRLRIAVGSGSGRVVWEGATSGLVVNALLKDHVRLPVAIDLPPGTEGQQLTLTVTEGHKVFSWSIAELRVFGK
jgi:hypothetical protein